MNWKARVAKEKAIFFWTYPLMNIVIQVAQLSGIIWLVFKGEAQILLVLLGLACSWLAMWWIGRKWLYQAEVEFNWQMSPFDQRMDEIIERLKRMEELNKLNLTKTVKP